MKKIIFPKNIFMLLGAAIVCIQCSLNLNDQRSIKITYPLDNTIFPADIAAPAFAWQDENNTVKNWEIILTASEKEMVKAKTSQTNWRPTEHEWQHIKTLSKTEQVYVSIKGVGRKTGTGAVVSFKISKDEVQAPIFFRAVPLPFKFARENLKRVKWHLGSISESSKPHVVLDNIPVCANCHSFTPEGGTLAMDVDARDDKGAYAISSLQKHILLPEDSIIYWSDFQNGEFTYGLLSRISPNGRYVVSTLKDCEIFADRKEMEYSQLFFPFKGILVVYDRQEKRYFELEGANDTSLVQSNPIWSPDGEFIYFTCAKAKHFEESGIKNGSVPKAEDAKTYQKFEEHYMKRDSLIKYNICKIPFNDGKGGLAIPVPGASNNGYSNYFPKISPDGKWLVFCRAESFMLLQKDSKLFITSTDGGEAREMTCNTNNMNSWHSWSPNSKWLVFATKSLGPYTQLALTHINDDGSDSPPVYLENFSFENYANNIPEFVNIKYDKDIKINPAFLSENDFLIRNGEIKLKEGDVMAAFNAFDEAIKLFPEQSEPYYQRGRIYFEKNQYEKAIDDFNTAIGIEQLATYYTSRGIAYLKLNKNDRVIEDLTRASLLDPTSYTPWTYLGVAYTNAENYSKAINCLEKAIGRYDQDAYTYYYLGLANFSSGNWEKANKALARSVNLGPEKSIVHLVYELKATALLNLGDYAGAIADSKKTIEISPKDPAPYLLKGKAELQKGLKEDAMRSFNMARSLGSKEAEIYMQKNI